MSESVNRPANAPRQASTAQSRDDGILRAWTEIDAAARRVDERYDGTPLRKPLSNPNLPATYAPTMKPAN